MNINRHLKISELAVLTNLPISTIKYYIREGLLPKRDKTGKTSAYFTHEHVDRLELIQKLKQDKKLTIKKIKGIIKETKGNDFESVEPADIFSSKRQSVMDAAIKLFREKGYHQTSVTDIVIAAGVGRNTFYSFYKNKEVLFLECADRIFHDLISEYEKELKNENDMTERLRKRLIHTYSLRPFIVDMLNIVKASSIDNDLFNEKFKQLMQNYVNVVAKELEAGMGAGVLKKINPRLISYLMVGIFEYGYHFMKHEPDISFDELLSQILWFMDNGFRLNNGRVGPPS